MEDAGSWKLDLYLKGLSSSRADSYMKYFGNTAKWYANVLSILKSAKISVLCKMVSTAFKGR